MVQRIKLVVVVCAGLALMGCQKTQVSEAPPDVLSQANLQYYWRLPLTLNVGEKLQRLYRLDENLYCLTERNRLIAIDAARGLIKWSFLVGDPAQTVFRPVHADGMLLPRNTLSIKEMRTGQADQPLESFDVVCINTTSYLLVLDRHSGEIYRRIPFDFAANTSGSTDGEQFYVGATNGWYYGIRLQEALTGWWLASEDMITAPVEYYNKRLYIADESGSLTVTQTGRTGQELWSQTVTGAVTAPFHVDKRGWFIPCDDHRLYALDSLTGRRLWDQPFACQGPLRDPVQVADSTIFQFAQRDKFYALDLVDGTARWSRADGRLVLAVMDGQVYLLNNNRILLIVDEVLGTVSASLPLTGWDLFVGNVSEPAIYLASRDGELACIRKSEAGRLKPDMLSQDGTALPAAGR